MANKVLPFFGAIKATPDGKGNLRIEGWANKAVVDDVGDLMTFEETSIDFSRFDLNPIMFYNHDRNQPIGRWTERKVTPEGLYLRGILSASEVPEIKRVRDLVEEGILNSLSIGYEEHEAARDAQGVNVVTKWKLNEVSIVTLPANTAAQFTVAKAMELGNAVKAAATMDDARQLLKTGLPTVEDPPADNQDPAKSCNPDDKPDDKADGDPKPPTGDDGNDDGGDTPAKPDDVPPGDKADGDQPPPNEDNKGDDTAKADFQECVSRKIPKLVAEGKTQEQAVAIAISMCSEEGKCQVPDGGFEFAQQVAKEAANKEVTAPMPNTLDNAGDGNPHLMLMQSQLAMLGQISNQLGVIAQALEKLVLVPQGTPDDNGDEPPPPQPPMPSDMDLQEIVGIGDSIKALVAGLQG